MEKFQELYDKVMDIISWARYQGHITEDAESILIDNIEDAKEEIEKK